MLFSFPRLGDRFEAYWIDSLSFILKAIAGDV